MKLLKSFYMLKRCIVSIRIQIDSCLIELLDLDPDPWVQISRQFWKKVIQNIQKTSYFPISYIFVIWTGNCA